MFFLLQCFHFRDGYRVIKLLHTNSEVFTVIKIHFLACQMDNNDFEEYIASVLSRLHGVSNQMTMTFHLSLSSQRPASSVLYHVLPSICNSAFLTGCSQLEFGLLLKHFLLSFIFKTSFSILSFFILKNKIIPPYPII